MRPYRAIRPLALAALLVAVSATPAPALSCPMLVDLAGDAYWLTKDVGWLGVPGPNFRNLDILSADVASGPTSVVAVIRVASLDPETSSNLGPAWAVGWEVDNGNWYAARARREALNGPYHSTFTVNDTALASVPFVLDVANGTITWTIPRTLIPELATPGAATFTSVNAFTNLFSSTADRVGDHTVAYVDQSPGCIPAA